MRRQLELPVPPSRKGHIATLPADGRSRLPEVGIQG
jgi:hypothetical protein